MALSTFESLWRGILLRCPSASVFLARSWTSFAFRQVAERRRWSWLVKRGQFLMPAVYKTGLVDLTYGSATVEGTGGNGWDGSLINRQFRAALQTPIYTIIDVPDATHLTLDNVWGTAAVSAINYEIWRAYVTVPTDFHAFISVWDPRYNWQLRLNVAQEELNAIDSQRAQTGTAWVVAQYAYDPLTTPPLPRYELWPYEKAQFSYPFLYESRPPDLEDAGASLPRYIRGDVLMEMALAQAARWPGASKDAPNPYFNLGLAMQHDARAERMLLTMEVQDDEVYENDLRYSSGVTGMPFASIPLGDASWLQTHAVGIIFVLGLLLPVILHLGALCFHTL